MTLLYSLAKEKKWLHFLRDLDHILDVKNPEFSDMPPRYRLYGYFLDLEYSCALI